MIIKFEFSGPGYCHQKQPFRSGKLIEIMESIKALNCLIGKSVRTCSVSETLFFFMKRPPDT